MRMEDEALGFSNDTLAQIAATALRASPPPDTGSDVASISGFGAAVSTTETSIGGDSFDNTPVTSDSNCLLQNDPENSVEKEAKRSPAESDHPEEQPDADSEVELEHELDNLLLGGNRRSKSREPASHNDKPKIGAAKAKRQKKADKLAALEAEGKTPTKSRKSHIPNPTAAMQKARGETATTGRKVVKSR